jgi:hypothetical protein
VQPVSQGCQLVEHRLGILVDRHGPSLPGDRHPELRGVAACVVLDGLPHAGGRWADGQMGSAPAWRGSCTLARSLALGRARLRFAQKAQAVHQTARRGTPAGPPRTLLLWPTAGRAGHSFTYFSQCSAGRRPKGGLAGDASRARLCASRAGRLMFAVEAACPADACGSRCRPPPGHYQSRWPASAICVPWAEASCQVPASSDTNTCV